MTDEVSMMMMRGLKRLTMKKNNTECEEDSSTQQNNIQQYTTYSTNSSSSLIARRIQSTNPRRNQRFSERTMEELHDALEDAQYVNAINIKEGPRPIKAWAEPTDRDLKKKRKTILSKKYYNGASSADISDFER
jgi:predicted RND superfamily exporter protein